MTMDPKDVLLESCLDEVLGGQTPPDLSGKILRAWSVRSGEPTNGSSAAVANRASMPVAPTAAPKPFVVPPIQAPSAGDGRAVVELPAVRRKHVTSRRNWFSLMVAASVLIAGLGAGIVALQFLRSNNTPDNNENVAKSPAPKLQNDGNRNATGIDGVENRIAKGKLNDPPAGHSPEMTPRASTHDLVHDGSAFDREPPFGGNNQALPSPFPAVAAATRRTPSPDPEVLTFVNNVLHESWQVYGVTRAETATDAEWCRRVYLRIVGRIPSVDELNQYTRSRDANKHAQLVDRLLASDEYARNWSAILTSVLIGRSGGTAADDLSSREGLQQYLQQSLYEGKPYDKIAYELISATGSATPGTDDYNGAVNYLLSVMNDKAILATARTSQVFLGTQLQCAQCHNHPTNGQLAQIHFWELNAFFRQMRVERDRQSGVVKLANEDFTGEGGDAREAEVYFENLNGKLEVAYPVFAGDELPKSGLIQDVDRRTELAKRIAASDNLGRALVNRVWAHFLGFGFTEPVDDMGPHNPPSNPDLLDRLSEEFAAHHYDLRDLIRWVALSDAFNRSSKLPPNGLADSPETGGQPLFSRYYTRQLQPEEVYQSLLLVADAGPGKSDFTSPQARIDWLGQFTRKMGTDEGEEHNSFDGSIHQSLTMMNGPLIKQAISKDDGSMLRRVAESKLTPEQKIDHLFLSALSRKPNHRERELAVTVLKSREQDQAAALQDVWWALLNSNEFILDH